MKFCFIILGLLLISNSYAWEVKTNKSDFFLVEKDQSYSIISEGGTPRFIKAEALNTDYTKVIYFAGTAGTSDPCDIYRALVVGKSSKKVVGDFPVSAKCASSPMELALWTLKDNKLEVLDPQTDATQTVLLP